MLRNTSLLPRRILTKALSASLILGFFISPATFPENASAATALTAPTLTAGVSTTTSISASWIAVPNRSSYLISVYAAGGALVETVSVLTTTAVLGGLSNSTTYTYGVVAIGDGATYSNSSETTISLTTGPTTLPVPTITSVTATQSGTQWGFTANWSITSTIGLSSYLVKIYDASNAVVYQGTAISSATSLAMSVAPSTAVAGTSTVKGPIFPNTSYRVTVTAVGDGTNYLNSAESTGVSQTSSGSVKFATPAAPTCSVPTYTGLTVTPASLPTGVEPVQTQIIVRDSGNSIVQTLGPTPGTSSIYGLTPGTAYQVSTYVIGDGTFFTSSDTSTSQTCTTSSPLNGTSITPSVVVSPGTSSATTTAAVSWSTDSNAKGYLARLYFTSDTSTAISQIQVTAGVLTATFTSLQPRTNYSVSVVPQYSSNVVNSASEIFTPFTTTLTAAQKLVTPVISTVSWIATSGSLGTYVSLGINVIQGPPHSVVIKIYDGSNNFVTAVTNAYTTSFNIPALDPTKAYIFTATAIGDGRDYTTSDPSTPYTLSPYASPLLPQCAFTSSVVMVTNNGDYATVNAAATCSTNKTVQLFLYEYDTSTVPLAVYPNYLLNSTVITNLIPGKSYSVLLTMSGDGVTYQATPVNSSRATITTSSSITALSLTTPTTSAVTAVGFTYNYSALTNVASATASIYKTSVSPGNLVQTVQLTGSSIAISGLTPATTYYVVSRFVPDGVNRITPLEFTTGPITTSASATLLAATPSFGIATNGLAISVTATLPTGAVSQTLYVYSDVGCTTLVQTIENYVSGTQITGLNPALTYCFKTKAFGDGVAYLDSALGTAATVSLSPYQLPLSPSIAINTAGTFSSLTPYITVTCTYCQSSILKIYDATGTNVIYTVPNFPVNSIYMLPLLAPNTSYRVGAISVNNGAMSAESSLVFYTTGYIADPVQQGLPQLTMTAVTQTSVTIGFSSGSVTASQYRAQLLDNAGNIVVEYPIFTSGTVISSLTPGTTYTFKLYSVGNGSVTASATIPSVLTFTTPRASGLLAPMIQAPLPTATSAVINFAATTPASIVAAYVLRLYDSNSNLIRTIPGAATGVVLGGLTPNTSYSVTLTAIGNAPLYTDSPESPPLTFTTLPQRQIQPPQVVLATSTGVTPRTVSFSIVTSANTVLVSGYFAKLWDQSCTTVIASQLGTSAGTLTFTGLTPSTSYCISAIAYGDGNSTLNSAEGGFTRFQTLPINPSVAAFPILTLMTPRSVTVGQYGLNGPMALIKIYDQNDNLLWSVPNLLASGVLTKLVTGLNPGTSYKVSLTDYPTLNTTTDGVEGQKITFTTPAVYKLRGPEPTITGSTLLPTSVAVNFTAQTGALSYRANVYLDTSTTLVTSIPNYVAGEVITGLTPSTRYSIKLVAIGDQANYTTSDESVALVFTTQAVQAMTLARANIQVVTSNSVTVQTTNLTGAWAGTNVLLRIYLNTGSFASPVAGRLVTSIPNYTSLAAVSGLSPSTNYLATVTLLSNVTTSASSAESAYTPFTTFPAGTVDSVVPYANGIYDDRVNVNWTAVTTTTSSNSIIRVYEADGTTLVTTIPNASTGYTVTGLRPSTTYRISVTFVGNGTGATSQVESPKIAVTTQAQARILAPLGNISAVTQTGMTVSFTSPSGAIFTRLRLYNGTDNSLLTEFPTYTSGTVISGLLPNTAYKFSLTSYANGSAYGNSVESALTSFTTLSAARLGPPTFTVSLYASNGFTVNPVAVTGAIGYNFRIYSSPGVLLRNYTATGAVAVTGLASNTTYLVTSQAISNGFTFTDSLESQYETATTSSLTQLAPAVPVLTNTGSLTATSAAFTVNTQQNTYSLKLNIYDSATSTLVTSIYPYSANSTVFGLTPNTYYKVSYVIIGDNVTTADSVESERVAFRTLATMPLPPPAPSVTQIQPTAFTVSIATVNTSTMASAITNIMKVYKTSDKSPVTTLNISTPAAFPVFNIVSASGNGSLVTYTTSTSHNLVPGQWVVVTGSIANTGSYIFSVPTPNTFTLVSTAAAATSTAAGTAATSSAPGRITGLLPDTSYDVVITSVANGSDYFTVSDAETITVKTLPLITLIAPTPSVVGITSTSVAPTYTTTQAVQSFVLRLYNNSDALQTVVPNFISGSVLSGLLPSTAYKISLQAIGDGVNSFSSSESSKASFTTPAISQLLAPTPILATLASSYASFTYNAVVGTSVVVGKLYSASGTLLATLPSYTSGQLVQGLSPQTTYKFSLTNFANEANFSDSLESPLATFTTISNSALLAPAVALTTITPTTANASFATVVGTARYVLSLYDSATSALISTYPNFVNGGIISGLNPNVAYKISITAIGNGSSLLTSPEGVKTTFTTLPRVTLQPPVIYLASAGLFPNQLNVSVTSATNASSYLIKVYASDSSTLLFSLISNSTSATISGLAANTSYFISGTAISGSADAISSAEGPKTQVTTLSVMKLASPPAIMTPTALTATSFAFNFAAQSNTARTIARVYDNSMTLVATIPSAMTGQIVSGLTASTRYYVTLQSIAVNGQFEDGPESIPTPVTTMTINKLLAPIPAISLLTSDSLAFTFGSVAGAASYLLKLYDATGSSLVAAYPDYKSNTVISGLNSNTTYLASLTVIANGVNSSTSLESNFVTAKTLAPIKLNTPTPTLNKLNASNISITYPSTVGATSFRLRIFSATGETLTTVENYVSGSVISGLTPATTYGVTITAIGNGSSYLSSTESAQLSVTTLALVQLLSPVPSVGAVTPASVAVTFTPIAGSISTTAFIYSASNALITTISGVVSGQVITGLNPGTSYKIALRAIGDGANNQTSLNGPTAIFTTLPSLALNAPTPVISNLLPTFASFTFTAVVGASSYTANVYSSSGTLITSVPNFISGSTISGLSPSTSYRVRIIAIGDGFSYTDSAESLAAVFTTLGTNKLGSVTPTPSTIYTTSVNFTILTPVTSAVSYLLKVYAADGTTLITSVPNFISGSSVTGLAPSTSYKASLMTLGDGANYLDSDESVKIAFTTLAQIQLISPIVGINTYSSNSALVNLTSVTGATGYTVSAYDSNTALVSTQNSLPAGFKQAITSASGTPAGIVYTTATPHTLQVGQAISLIGFTPGAFNANTTVSSIISPTQFMTSIVTTAVATVIGTVSRSNVLVTLDGLRAGETYTVRAKSLGDGANFTDSDYGVVTRIKTLPSTALLSPAPILNALTATSAKFTFTAPAGTSSSVLNLYATDDSLITSINNFTTGTSVTGLNPGTTYKAAIQSIGDGISYVTGVESARTTFTTYASATLLAPTPQLSTTTPTSFAFTFSSVAGASSATLKVYASNQTTIITTIPGYVSGTVVTGLTPNTNYYVSLNLIGDGVNYISSPDSPKVSVATIALTPLLPATPIFAGSTPSSISLTYTPTSGVVSYTAKLYSANGLTSITTVPNYVSGASISGLTAGTTYRVSLIAIGDGVNNSSSPESAQISAATTSIPKLLAPTPFLTLATPSSASFSFTAVSGSQSYTLSVYASDSSTLVTTVPSYISGAAISGLDPLTSYYVTLTAVGDGANYTTSNPSPFVLIRTTTPPALLAITPSLSSNLTTSAAFTFTSATGAVSYTGKIYSSSRTLVATISNYVSGAAITGLSAATNYFFSLTANGDGANYLSAPESDLVAFKTIDVPTLLAPNPTLYTSSPTSLSFDFASLTGATSYTLKIYASNGSTLVTTIPNYANRAVISGLSKTTTYKVSLIAVGDGVNYLTSSESLQTQVSTPDITTLVASVPTLNSSATNSLSFAFSPVTGASSYTLQVKLTDGTLVTSIPSFKSGDLVSGLTADSSYRAGLIAVGDGINFNSSGLSDLISVKTLAIPNLLAPTASLSASSATTATFTYALITGANNYNAKIYSADGSTLLSVVPSTSGSFVVSGLYPATTYSLAMVALGDGVTALNSGESTRQQFVTLSSTTLLAPTLSVSLLNPGSISAAFQGVSGAISYNAHIYRSNGTTLVKNVNNYTSGAVITGLSPSTTYKMTLTAVGDGLSYLTSADSTASIFTTPALPALLAPVPTLISSLPTSINIGYQTVAGAVSYTLNVYNLDGTSVGTTTSFVSGGSVANLSPETTYLVSIIAVGDNLNNLTSDESQKSRIATSSIPTLLAPTPTVSATMPTSVSLAFSSVVGATSYRVKVYAADGTTLRSTINGFASGSAITGLTANTSYSVSITALGDEVNYTTSAEGSRISVTTSQIPTLLAPTPSVSASTSTSLTINFSTVTGASSYTLKVYAADGFTLIGSARTGFTSGGVVNGLTASTTYKVSITAIGDGNNYLTSAESAKTSSTTDPIAALLAPTPSLITAGQTSLTVGFTSVSGATGYRLKLYASDGTSLINTIDPFVANSVISGLTADTTYKISITALGDGTSATTSSESSKVSVSSLPLATLVAPLPVLAGASPTTLTFTYSAIAGATSYTLKVFGANGVTAVSTLSNFSSGDIVTGLTGDTTYKVGLIAIGDGVSNQNSSTSARVSAKTAAPIQLIAPSISFISVMQSSIKIQFTPVLGALSYTLNQYSAAGSLLRAITDVENDMLITNLVASTTYKFRLVAIGNQSTYLTSSESTQVTVTTSNVARLLEAPIDPPTSTSNSITPYFEPVPGATGYSAKLYAQDGTTLLRTIPGITSGQEITGLNPNTVYKLTFISVGDGVNYLDSLESAADVIQTLMVTPTLSVSTVSSTTAIATFAGVTGASSYTLRVYESDGYTVRRSIQNYTSGSTISGLIAGTTYGFTITAIGNGTTYLESLESEPTSGTTPGAGQLAQPSFTLSATSTSITANFADVPDASSYSAKLYTDAGVFIRQIDNLTSGSAITLTSGTRFGISLATIGDEVSYFSSPYTSISYLKTVNQSTLSAPTFTASASSGSVSLSFTANINALSYVARLYNSAGNSLLNQIDGYTSGSSIPSLNAGTGYKITLTAIGDGINYISSSESAKISFTTVTVTTLTAPVLTLTRTNTTITPTFPAIVGASSYSIKLFASDGTTLLSTTSNYTSGTPIIGLAKGVTYKVSAISIGDGFNYLTSSESAKSSVTTTNPVDLSAPSLSLVSRSPNSLTISFTPDANALRTSLSIYSASGATLLRTVNSYSSGSAITGLVPSTTYNFVAQSIGDNINFATSDPGVSVQLATAAPISLMAPTVNFKNISLTSAQATFSTVSGATSYTIKLYDAGNTLLLTVDSANPTATDLPNLIADTSYGVTITVNGDGSSYLSSAESSAFTFSTTSLPSLLAPTPSINPGTSSAVVIFTAIENAVSYTLNLYQGGTIARVVTNFTSGSSLSDLNQGTAYSASLIANGDEVSYLTSSESSKVSFTTNTQLAAPTFSVSKTSTTLTATFTDVARASGYTLKLYESDLTTVQRVISNYVSGTSITGVLPSTTYGISVSTRGNDTTLLSSPNSNISSVTTDASLIPVIATPTFTTSSTTTSIVLSYSRATGSDHYTAKLYSSTGSYIRSVNSSGTSATISGLIAGTTYKVSLIAVGDGVNGLNSEESTKVTIELPRELGIPTALTTFSGTSLSVTVGTVSNALSYTVKVYSASTASLIRTVTNYVSGSSITGFSTGESYNVRVLSVGDGTRFLTSAESTPELIRIPGALSTPTFSVTATPSTIVVTFSRNPAANSYEIRVYDATGVSLISTTANAVTGTAISSLSSGNTYKVSLKAIGDGSVFLDSDESSKISITTPITLSAPTATDTVGDTWISADFAGVAHASGYIYELKTSDGSLLQRFGAYVSGTRITGLTPNTAYLYSLFAKGDGTQYVDSAEFAGTFTTKITLAIPTLSITSDSSTANLNFSPVAHALSYTVRIYSPNSSVLSTYTNAASGDSVTALSQGTIYRATIQALGDNSTYFDSAESTLLNFQLRSENNSNSIVSAPAPRALPAPVSTKATEVAKAAAAGLTYVKTVITALKSPSVPLPAAPKAPETDKDTELTVQWFKNGNPITVGENWKPTLAADSGLYTAKVVVTVDGEKSEYVTNPVAIIIAKPVPKPLELNLIIASDKNAPVIVKVAGGTAQAVTSLKVTSGPCTVIDNQVIALQAGRCAVAAIQPATVNNRLVRSRSIIVNFAAPTNRALAVPKR